MKRRLLLTVLMLIGLLPAAQVVSVRGARAAETALQTAPGEPVQAQEADTFYSIEWDIRAVGHQEIQSDPKTREVHHREITIAGRAISRKSPSGEITTIPMELTLTDDTYDHYTLDCYETYRWKSITDPGRYNGGPDPTWTGGMFLMRLYRDDGSVWGMENPISPPVFTEWQTYRSFNYHTRTKDMDCDGGTSTNSYDLEKHDYDNILWPLEEMPLEADPTGTIFTLDTEYVTEHGSPPLTVKFHATVRTGSCIGLPAPIDISNPAIASLELNLQAENTTPDDQAEVQATVTCQGVPVVNAPVVVTLKAKQGSGGHHHDDGKRPRGYIDGVEIKANTKFIGITGRDGTVTFSMEPGRDLTDKLRGIAGLYVVNAWVEWEGFYPYQKSAYVNASLNLVPLPENDQDYIFNSSSSGVHPQTNYGTPGTVDSIQKMAQFWMAEQNLHNWSLESKGKEPWPILQLMVWAVSLPSGGLFDARAASNGMWRSPYKQHRTGEEANFSLYFLNPDTSKEQDLWYDRVFRKLGSEFGTWFSDYGMPLNLKFTHGSGLQTQSSFLASGQNASTGPDVAAYAALVDPAGRFVAGAAQQVTYAVGVENLAADTVASGVELRAELPAGLNFVSADPGPDDMADARTPVWNIGSLPDESAPRAFEVTAQIDPSTAAGDLLVVTAKATCSLDADLTNNQYEDWGLTVQPPGPDLVIDSDLSRTALTVSEAVTVTVQLGNDGNAPATTNWLELAAPAGITILATEPTASVIPNGVRWDAGDLLPGDWQTFTIRLDVDSNLLDLAALDPDLEPVYPLAFTLEAGSNEADIDPASNLLQVGKRVEVPGPDLLVALQTEGTPGPGVFQVGQVVTSTLRYGNFGNRDAGDAKVSLLLWPGLNLVESQPAPDTDQLDATSGVRTLIWNAGELSVGVEGVIVLRLRVDNVPEVGGIIKADISSLSTDLNPADNWMMETRYEPYNSSADKYNTFLPVVTR